MHHSSKYATLALLISTVGPSALRAADGFPPEASAPQTYTRLTFKKPVRAEERRARAVARRMKELIEASKRV